MLQPAISTKDHRLGLLPSPLELVEYGDYECPYCGEAYSVIKRLERKLRGKLLFVFRNFPLIDVHPHALHAAYAAEAAGKQNKFWHMHDLLYENQGELEDEDLREYADALELRMDQFERDMYSKDVEKKVQDDIESGLVSGVNGTPTFYINGKQWSGGYAFEDLYSELTILLKGGQYGKV